MPKKVMPARRRAYTTAGASIDLHVIDSAKYEVSTLGVDGNGVPRLLVESGTGRCTLYFETTDQVKALADTLSNYLRHNEVKRPEPIERRPVLTAWVTD